MEYLEKFKTTFKDPYNTIFISKVRDIAEIHPRCARDAPEMHPRCTRDTPEMHPRYARDAPYRRGERRGVTKGRTRERAPAARRPAIGRTRGPTATRRAGSHLCGLARGGGGEFAAYSGAYGGEGTGCDRRRRHELTTSCSLNVSHRLDGYMFQRLCDDG